MKVIAELKVAGQRGVALVEREQDFVVASTPPNWSHDDEWLEGHYYSFRATSYTAAHKEEALYRAWMHFAGQVAKIECPTLAQG